MENLTLEEEGALGMLIAAEIVRLEKEVAREDVDSFVHMDVKRLKYLKSAAEKVELNDFIESYKEVIAQEDI